MLGLGSYCATPPSAQLFRSKGGGGVSAREANRHHSRVRHPNIELIDVDLSCGMLMPRDALCSICFG